LLFAHGFHRIDAIPYQLAHVSSFLWLLLNSLADRRLEPTALFVCCHTVLQAPVSSVVRLHEQEKALAGKELERPVARFSLRLYSSVGQWHLMVLLPECWHLRRESANKMLRLSSDFFGLA
ncbi:MAG: hypothetical protein M3294_08240, partial [Pseudomonadota bacterium]|nr:hypothetical protein [Pseudomonadota bacterium]